MFRISGVEMSTWLLGIFMALSCVVAGGFPAERAVSEAYSHNDSSTTLYSSDNYLKCTSDLQVTVASTQEISDLIKLHTSGKEPVRIRATRRGFHSSMGFVCSGHRGSSHPEYREDTESDDQLTSVTVLLHLMNRVVAVDNDHHQMTVEAGMTLRELTLAAEANHMSVPAGTLSIYGNLTIGGSIMTSAHGTAYRTATSLGDLVQKLKWVNANGEVILSEVQSHHGANEVRALVGGLGLLGIVTEITLQLQPNSQTIVEVRNGLNDATMVADLKKFLQEETPHVAAFWRPDFGTYKAALWTQVEDGKYDSTTTPKFYPNGTIAIITPFDAQVATSLKHLMAAWEDDVTDESPSADLLNAGKVYQQIITILHS
jgi:L-gulonolactone oxidase